MAKLTEYEIERQKNIERNRKILESLNLDTIKDTILVTKPKPPPKDAKKRKSKPTESDEQKENEQDGSSDGRPRKAARVAETRAEDDGEVSLRRSSRNTGKKIDYVGIEQDRSVRAYRISTRAHQEMRGEPRDTMKRTQDPKQYGHIPGVEVGAWWETRQACSADAIHAPWVGGISCGSKGAFSIVLSGGYDDDVDLGSGFTYTGSGGRDLKGTKDKPKNLRTAPQSSDQTFENHFNKALKISSESKRPVRVVRGFKLKSPYAPVEGYRYDGLYTIERAWQEVGVNSKWLVCKYAFKRLTGQPPLPVRDLEAETRVGKEAVDNGSNDSEASEDESEETKVASTRDAGSLLTEVDADADGEADEEA